MYWVNGAEVVFVDEIQWPRVPSGVPHRWSRTDVRVHPTGKDPPLSGSVVFIVPKSPSAVLNDLRATEKFLSGITGGRVKIREVRPYRAGNDPGALDHAPDLDDADKSVVVALVTYAGEPSVVNTTRYGNQTSNVVIVKEYRADSTALFWFLLFLALMLAVAIFILVTCFFHSGCPLYYRRKERVPPRSAEEVRLVLEREPRREEPDKLVIRREAWSADGGTHRYIQFNRRNILTLDPRPNMDDGRRMVHGGMAPVDGQHVPGQSHSVHHEFNAVTAGPSIIYTREVQQDRQPKHREVYLEDVESDYQSSRQKHNLTTRESTRSLPTIIQTHPNIVCIRDRNGKRIFVHQEESTDEIDSMRRHEMERGSDLGQGRYIMRERSTLSAQIEPDVVEVLTLDEEDANGREQHYVKVGNAEVLRLLTRGKIDDRHTKSRRVHQTDAGKDIIMRRFMEDQRHHNSISEDSNHVQLPGQVLMQRGIQTDEDRVTQTENESITSQYDTPPQTEHAKHVIKTPILEENESSLEQIASGLKSNREPSFQQVNEMYEKEKAETEFNYGDTKSSVLRRKLNNEKAGVDGNSPDEVKKQKSEKQHGTTLDPASREKEKKTQRSHSVPRNFNDSKRTKSLTESQKLSKQRSTSINSGLDKTSRVTFASPDNCFSDEEFSGSHPKKISPAMSSSNGLKVGNTSLNKSSAPSPKRHRSRQDSVSDDELLTVPRNQPLKRASSYVSIHKDAKAHGEMPDRSISDDESNVKSKVKKPASSSRASTTSVKSNKSSAGSIRRARKDVSEDENVKKANNSLRITKASSSRKSPSPAVKGKKSQREGSYCSDEENNKFKRVKSRVDSRRSSVSVSPSVRARKPRRDRDSDEDIAVPKSKEATRTTDSNLKKSKVITKVTQKKYKGDESVDDKSRSATKHRSNNTLQASKSSHSKVHSTDKSTTKRTASTKKEKIKKNETSKNSYRQNDSDLESDEEPSANTMPKHVLHSGLTKALSPTYEALVPKIDGEDEQDDEDEDAENTTVLLSPNYSQDMNDSNTSLQSAQSNETNTYIDTTSEHTKDHSHKEVKSNIKNDIKNMKNILQNSSVGSNETSEGNDSSRVYKTSDTFPSPSGKNFQDSNEHPVETPTVTVQSPSHSTNDDEPQKTAPSERLETAMQTDVTLVPLINSLGRSVLDDDLDSGIAMSQTLNDGRSKRLNQLIEKKSIFTIAYDDMQTKQLRADSASPQY